MPPSATPPGDAGDTAPRPALTRWGWFWLTGLCITLLWGYANGTGRVESAFIDRLSSLDGRPAADDIVIVAIDERSLARLGRWPWRRSVHAALLDRLHEAQPRAVGLDLILAEDDSQHPEDDVVLAEAIRRSGNVVLPLHMQLGDDQQPQAALPAQTLALAARALGHIHVELGEDGVARSVFLRGGMGTMRWDHWTLALMKAGGEALPHEQLPGTRRTPADDGTAARASTWSRDHWMQIPFAGPPGHFARVSYVDVLDGRVPAQMLRGKYLLVGATAVGMGDAFPTPMASQDALMPGVEVSANVLDALRRGIGFRRAQPWENALFCALPVALAMLALYRLRPRRALVAVAALMLTVIAASWWAQAMAGVQFAPLAALGALATLYPLWSWLRLEAAIDYLARELRRTQRDDKLLTALATSAPTGDELDRRMRAMTQALSQLRELQRFVRDSVDGLSDAVLVTDRCGTVLLVNEAACRHFGMSADALHDRSVDALLAGHLFPIDGQALPRLAFATGTRGLEIPARDAQQRDLLLKCMPRHTRSGNPAGWNVSVVDISTVQQAQRQREEALRFISHDMRAPQASILTLIELQRIEPEAPDARLFERIEGHARRTLALADDFVQLARAQSHAFELEPIDLADVLIDAADRLWEQARARGAEISAHATPDACWAAADRDLLTRAVANLIDNALKYGPEGGCVRCTLSSGQGRCTISVRDDGPGIAAQDQLALFDAFDRLGRDHHSAGAGLGLAFVQAVVLRHQGTVSVRSRLGEGAEFRIELPLLQVPPDL